MCCPVLGCAKDAMFASQVVLLTAACWIVLGALAENTGDAVFPDTCSDNTQCGHLHPFAVCRLVNLISASGTFMQEKRCACDVTHSYYFENGTCVKHIRVLQPCEDGGGRCVDRYSECVDDGSGGDYHRCMCQAGAAQVRDDDKYHVCARLISVTEDPLCRACEANGGKCYDLEEDGIKDGCICPVSMSGPDCQHVHVHVSCEQETMRVCYDPHPGFDFSRGARVYVDGAGHLSQCVGVPAPGECGPGQFLLRLPLDESGRHTCSTFKHRPDESSVKYENMLIAEKGEDADGGADDMIIFKTYCLFKTHVEAGFMGQRVYSAYGDNVEDRRNKEVTFSAETALGESIPRGVLVKTGDSVKFRLFLDTASGYESLRVEACLFSDLPVMHSAAQIIPVIDHGCPLKGQLYLGMINFWQFVTQRRNEMETGLIRIPRVSSEPMVFLHCTIRVCLRGYEALCDPIACPTDDRKRRGLEEDQLEVQLLHVTAGLAVWEGEEETAHAQNGGVHVVSIGLEVVIGLSVAFVVLAICVVVVIYLLTKHSRSLRITDDRQELHKDDAKDYGTDAGSRTTQTRI